MTEVSSCIFRQTYIIITVDGLLEAAVMNGHQMDAQAGARPTIWPTVRAQRQLRLRRVTRLRHTRNALQQARDGLQERLLVWIQSLICQYRVPVHSPSGVWLSIS